MGEVSFEGCGDGVKVLRRGLFIASIVIMIKQNFNMIDSPEIGPRFDIIDSNRLPHSGLPITVLQCPNR